ncbi:DUF4238 domain-containing protein [Paenarthrobacter sp. YJN-5]|uniref:DUF4238 domain-containing protein n=1 Tax=Paenarthrobacter sp. YJN-5 TaxID=2735316 RepID=UPI00187857C8|nr:DUF4238 domain-containing protein [Paenarthrobacter sp. YJN-5]QOT19247.1 DUF4238 domain-containing protein [Paenarthrobacter sp. YJN-5]
MFTRFVYGQLTGTTAGAATCHPWLVKNNPTTRQHVVSQALLNRFASPDGLISAYDVRWGDTKQKTSKAIGFQENFVKHEPDAAEAIWREVEDRIGPAFTEIDQQPAQLSALTEGAVKDLVALHFARSLATAAGHEQALADTERRVRSDTPTLARLARLKYQGLHLEHAPSILAEIADGIMADVRSEESAGIIFRDDVLRYFGATRTSFTSYSLMVRPVVTGAELLLGDCPAISVSREMASSSIRSPLFDANLIAMPLGPNHVAFVYPDGIEEPVIPVGPEQALHLNGIQVDQASRQVYSRPGSGLDMMARARRAPLRKPDRM